MTLQLHIKLLPHHLMLFTYVNHILFLLVDLAFAMPSKLYSFKKKGFCLFVWGFMVSLENFSRIWRLHHYRWRAANFDLCSTLMAIEQWGFFSVPHLLWHGASVHNCHLRGPATLTSITEGLAVELSLPVFAT